MRVILAEEGKPMRLGTWKKLTLGGLIVLVATAVVWICWTCLSCPMTTVLLVRHAEKAALPADDPVLSPEGTVRANELKHVAEDAGVSAIFTSTAQRARLTAQPLALYLGLTPVEFAATATDSLVDSIRIDHRGQTVLVVGHSNTVPEIIQALGGPTVPAILENEYDNLYIITIRRFCFWGMSRSVRALRLKYGAET
jgi:broad specificity phosphatase PhoE